MCVARTLSAETERDYLFELFWNCPTVVSNACRMGCSSFDSRFSVFLVSSLCGYAGNSAATDSRTPMSGSSASELISSRARRIRERQRRSERVVWLRPDSEDSSATHLRVFGTECVEQFIKLWRDRVGVYHHNPCQQHNCTNPDVHVVSIIDQSHRMIDNLRGRLVMTRFGSQPRSHNSVFNPDNPTRLNSISSL